MASNIKSLKSDASKAMVSEKAKLVQTDPLPPIVAMDLSKDYNFVKKLFFYWDEGIALHRGQPKPEPEDTKYVLFDTDCGGFNNIRMGFEYMVMMAYAMNRTLVFPPPHGWYLIDWGPRKRMKSADTSGLSDYPDYFVNEHMQMAVPTISTADFLARQGTNLKVPEKYIKMHEEKSAGRNWELRMAYKREIGNRAKDEGWGLGWGIGGHVLYWPDAKSVEQKNPVDRNLVSGRRPVEYGPVKDLTTVHFPSCLNEDSQTGTWRYLGQVANMIFFDDPEKDKDLKRMLRDHVHYLPEVFEIAAEVVSKIGLFNYAAYHVRRNDLQYKDSFIGAEKSYQNTEKLLQPGENIYVATDETSDKFFDVFPRNNHKTYFWHDFFGDKAKPDLKISRPVNRKLIGCIEQVICAGARIFFGTRSSTFSAYITRLRGYFKAPDTNSYLHNNQHSGNPETDKLKVGHRSGNTYMLEFSSMWELD